MSALTETYSVIDFKRWQFHVSRDTNQLIAFLSLSILYCLSKLITVSPMYLRVRTVDYCWKILHSLH